MIGLAFALLAASSAGPERRTPSAATERFDFDPSALLGDRKSEPPAVSPNRTTSPTPRGGGRWYNEWDLMEHEHRGRLAEQYARQPRVSAHRICRGRP